MCRKSVNLIQPIFLRFVEGVKRSFSSALFAIYIYIHIVSCVKLRLRGSLMVVTNSRGGFEDIICLDDSHERRKLIGGNLFFSPGKPSSYFVLEDSFDGGGGLVGLGTPFRYLKRGGGRFSIERRAHDA